MAYVVGQYNHNNASSGDADFFSAVMDGTVDRRKVATDSGTTGTTVGLFTDECITGLNLVTSKYYYFRCQIKRMTKEQIFTIKLVNYETIGVNAVEQFIKQVTIGGGDPNEWVSVEFIFNPVIQFDTILFNLQRTIDDYRTMVRYPKIAYVQLCSLNNLITMMNLRDNVQLLKIGVQSRPGLAMCINGEEIHMSRTGIFEIKNGVIPVVFFMVVNPAEEVNKDVSDSTAVVGWEADVTEQIKQIEAHDDWTDMKKEEEIALIQSKCFFGTPKKYAVDSFTLDYMYSD